MTNTSTNTPKLDALLKKIHDYADTVRADADDAVEKLESYASLPFQTWIDFASRSPLDLQKAQRVTGSSLPTMQRATLDYSADFFNPDLYKRPVYVSSFFDFLQPILEDQIENGGPGISQSVQDALFNQTRERDLQILRDSLDEVDAGFGRRGFPMPPDMMYAARDAVIARHEDRQSQRNREITVIIAERAQQNMQVAISSGVSMENIQSSFSLGFAKLFQDHTSQLLEKYKTEQAVLTSEFDGRLKAILAEVQIEKINADLETAFSDQQMKKWEVEATLATEQTKALIQQGMQATEVKLKAASSLSDFYRTMTAAALDQFNGIISATKSEE